MLHRQRANTVESSVHLGSQLHSSADILPFTSLGNLGSTEAEISAATESCRYAEPTVGEIQRFRELARRYAGRTRD